jgi:FSR family fosmidomycin resistance protein-like MFS transporter
MAGSHFFHDVFSSFLPIVLPLLIERLDLSLLAAGGFTLVFRLPTLFSPLIGRLGDARDLGRLAALTPAATAIGMSLLGHAPNYAIVCVLVLVAGTSSAVLHVLGPVFIAREATGGYGRGMGLWMLGGESARTVGPVFAAWCLTAAGARSVLPVIGLGVLISLLLWARSVRATTQPAAATAGQAQGQPWGGLLARMAPFAFPTLARAAMVGTLVSFLPTYLVGTGKSLWDAGLAFSVMQCGGIFGTLLGGWAGDRYGQRRVLAAAFPVSAALILALGFVAGPLLYFLLALLGVVIFAIAPAIMALLQTAFPKDQGAANGVYTTLNFAATALATLLSGWVADRWGFAMAFQLNAALGIVALPMLFRGAPLPGSTHS